MKLQIELMRLYCQFAQAVTTSHTFDGWPPFISQTTHWAKKELAPHKNIDTLKL
jgi:hypothetical protein